MSAIYDTYDYPKFWENREYEHRSEVIALKSFLNKIHQINRLIDVGAGYGRLSAYYMYRAKRSVLVDSSAKLLKVARQKINSIDSSRGNDMKYIQSSVENLSKKVKNGSFDVVLCVRFLHHFENPNVAIDIAKKLLNKNGYLILEFPNKLHGKALAKHIIKGNIGYRKNKEHENKKHLMNCSLPYMNFHPAEIQNELNLKGFRVIEKRSVSNIRNTFLKKHMPLSALLFVEQLLQIPLSKLNFGPSIFVLAQKKG